ncbi:hypothetical protein WBP06_22235 [Novosphingobium sp. BL-8H]|uniref:hypothetical protein n=1 Tax=Novosphingobium sp. BL-8H TaxID=3127640 RepID=UPI003756F7A2
MKNAGQMHRADLEVTVLRAGPLRIDGRVAGGAADDGPMLVGMDVAVFLNPPHTAFTDPEIAGQARVYEDRIEIDLVLPQSRVATLAEALGEGAALQFQTRAITDTLFRIEAVGTV